MLLLGGRSCGLSVAAIRNHIGESVVWPLFFLSVVVFSVNTFLFFLLPSLYPLFFPLSSQCDGCPNVPVWGLMGGLQGL